MLNKNEKEIILESIRDVKDFPKKGIIFKDITTLLNNPEAFQLLMNHLENRYKDFNLDYIVGIEARGFIFGSVLADRLKIGFVPIRKKGKLPFETISQKYKLEYGYDEVEIQIDAFNQTKNPRVLIIDDLCATGGTAIASCKLIKKLEANLIEICFIINISSLNGSKEVKKFSTLYNVLNI